MITTTKYGLKKPAENDYYNVEDANFNADKIEEELGKSEDHRIATNPHSGAVPTTRKINNKALSANITLVPADIGAVSAKPVTSVQGAEIGVVTSVNGKTGAVMLSAQDVGARDQSWMPSLREVGGSGRNLLDNSYWGIRSAIINQRGQGMYSADGYCIDRFVASNCTIGVGDGGITLAPSGSWAQLEQRVENYQALRGCQVTFSARILNCSCANAKLVIDDGDWHPVADITGSGIASGTYTVSAAASRLSVIIFTNYTASSSPSGTMDIHAVKLEIGAVSSLANDPPPNYQQELAKCQRYFIKISPGSRFRMSDHSPNTLHFLLPMPVVLRINPALIGDFRLYDWNPTLQTGFTFSTMATPTGVLIMATKNNHGVTDGLLYTSSILYLDANL